MLGRLSWFAVAGLIVFATGCGGIQDLVSTSPADYLSMTAATSSIAADGVSSSLITVHLSSAAPSDERTIEFITSGGYFGESSSATEVQVEADVNGNAIVELRAITIGSAIVEARVGSFARSVRVDFVRAYPDRLGLDASPLSVEASFDGVSALVATLGRNYGQVTEGTIVTWSATDANGQRIGSFFDIQATDAMSQALASFTPGDTTYRGHVTIRAETRDAGGSLIAATVLIEVTDP